MNSNNSIDDKSSTEVDAAAHQAAEELRLLGNEAFRRKKWDKALTHYRASVQRCERASAHSNIAITLNKLGRYEEAAVAAERATVLDPKWAKGWWRRATVAELLRQPFKALEYYKVAVELAPEVQEFQAAKTKMEGLLNVAETNKDGHLVVDSPMSISQDSPSLKAWARFCEGNLDRSLTVYIERQPNFPSGRDMLSEQWLNWGLHEWSEGLKDAVAGLILYIDPQTRNHYGLLEQMLPHVRDPGIRQLLGTKPRGIAVEKMAIAISTLGGIGILQQVGDPDGNIENTKHYLCPQPEAMSKFKSYQHIAIMYSLFSKRMQMASKFGENVKVSPALIEGSNSFMLILRKRNATLPGQEATPEETVAFMKDQLQNGRPWDDLRRYAAGLYMGTILYAVNLRVLAGYHAECYKREQWARTFIDLADKEFKVAQDGSYFEKIGSFEPRFRLGMMLSELQSLSKLVNEGQIGQGAFSSERLLDHCMEIIIIANTLEVTQHPNQPRYYFALSDVAERRKPLARAHSFIGSYLSKLKSSLPSGQWVAIVHKYSLHPEDKSKDPHCTIADHYRRAAEAELPDADECAGFWYGCGASIAQAGPVSTEEGLSNAPYELGDLRTVLASALKAEKLRDTDLFWCSNQASGVGPALGNPVDQAVVKLTVEHFEGEPNSFRLPGVRMIKENDGDNASTRLVVGDDELISSDLNNNNDHLPLAMQSLGIEQEHGVDLEEENSMKSQSE